MLVQAYCDVSLTGSQSKGLADVSPDKVKSGRDVIHALEDWITAHPDSDPAGLEGQVECLRIITEMVRSEAAYPGSVGCLGTSKGFGARAMAIDAKGIPSSKRHRPETGDGSDSCKVGESVAMIQCLVPS